ncbi:MAG TPA: Type 1 glutamine amidotransferase-like domain-containing protein [Ktedonobacteraceae bacterium]|nr:Type 1 glutamine amidotransferase-like domain-containing protein [Ktedonobacteraceae bacterium]
MVGHLLLAGGAEFGGRMAQPDQRAIELAGGADVPISIIPTAAAADHNERRAGRNGVNWFHGLGATHVESVPIIDRASAQDAALAAIIRRSRLVYMLGGFTGYLGETLQQSVCLDAMRAAYDAGAVIAGSSAGAMVMCQYYYDPGQRKVAQGFAFVPNACVLPHHNSFGKHWAAQLTTLLPDAVLVGIDEHTGMLDDRHADGDKTVWRVYGRGAVTLYYRGRPTTYASGQACSI